MNTYPIALKKILHITISSNVWGSRLYFILRDSNTNCFCCCLRNLLEKQPSQSNINIGKETYEAKLTKLRQYENENSVHTTTSKNM